MLSATDFCAFSRSIPLVELEFNTDNDDNAESYVESADPAPFVMSLIS